MSSVVNVVLGYSVNSGGTWTTESFVVHLYELDIVPELAFEHQLVASGRLIPTWKRRGTASLYFDWDNFLPTAISKWHWLTALYEKPLIRMSHDSGLTLDGVTLWQSATNTNYIVPDGPPERVMKNNLYSARIKFKTRDWV